VNNNFAEVAVVRGVGVGATSLMRETEILRPYAGEAVALQDVAEFVFAEHIGPDVR
jgi:hypothetical protein